MQHGKQTLGQMLVAANLIDEVQMQIALAEQRRTGKRFGSTLVDLKFIDENVLAAFLSKHDPIFRDLIEELDEADLDGRLSRMEKSLDQIWTLLEKLLRTLEIRTKT